MLRSWTSIDGTQRVTDERGNGVFLTNNLNPRRARLGFQLFSFAWARAAAPVPEGWEERYKAYDACDYQTVEAFASMTSGFQLDEELDRATRLGEWVREEFGLDTEIHLDTPFKGGSYTGYFHARIQLFQGQILVTAFGTLQSILIELALLFTCVTQPSKE